MFNGQQTDQRQSLQPPSPFGTSSTSGSPSSGASPQNSPGGNLDGVNQNIKLCIMATNNFALALSSVFSEADLGV